jgi:hypothetical protein
VSDKAEQFAGQLLEKTEAGKVQWRLIEGEQAETYKSDLEGIYEFWVSRTVNGENKVIEFRLTSPGGIVFSRTTDNLIAGSIPIAEGNVIGGSRFSKVNSFTLFSKLFHAARESALDGDHALEKVQQLLERLG